MSSPRTTSRPRTPRRARIVVTLGLGALATPAGLAAADATTVVAATGRYTLPRR